MAWDESGSHELERVDEARRILAIIGDNTEDLNDADRKFLEEIRERLENGANVRISPRQLFWLRDINMKVD